MTAQDHLKAHIQKRVTLTKEELDDFSQSFFLNLVRSDYLIWFNSLNQISSPTLQGQQRQILKQQKWQL